MARRVVSDRSFIFTAEDLAAFEPGNLCRWCDECWKQKRNFQRIIPSLRETVITLTHKDICLYIYNSLLLDLITGVPRVVGKRRAVVVCSLPLNCLRFIVVVVHLPLLLLSSAVHTTTTMPTKAWAAPATIAERHSRPSAFFCSPPFYCTFSASYCFISMERQEQCAYFPPQQPNYGFFIICGLGESDHSCTYLQYLVAPWQWACLNA